MGGACRSGRGEPRRLGLEINGIGLPAHFIVGVQIGREQVLLDPFNGGTILTPDSAQELVSRVLGRPVTLQEEHFAPVTKRQLLARMLRNLKAIYWRRKEWGKALPVAKRLLALEPDSPEEIRDRGHAPRQPRRGRSRRRGRGALPRARAPGAQCRGRPAASPTSARGPAALN